MSRILLTVSLLLAVSHCQLAFFDNIAQTFAFPLAKQTVRNYLVKGIDSLLGTQEPSQAPSLFKEVNCDLCTGTMVTVGFMITERKTMDSIEEFATDICANFVMT